MLISACSEWEQLNTNGEIRVHNYVALANWLSQLSKHMGSGTICTVFKMFVYACARICVGPYVHVHTCFCYLMGTFSGINGNQRLVLMWKRFISDLLVWFNRNVWTDARVRVGVGLWTVKGSPGFGSVLGCLFPIIRYTHENIFTGLIQMKEHSICLKAEWMCSPANERVNILKQWRWKWIAWELQLVTSVLWWLTSVTLLSSLERSQWTGTTGWLLAQHK